MNEHTAENDATCPMDDPTVNQCPHDACWKAMTCQRVHAPPPADALADAAAWIADSIGYPVQTNMPDHPMPQALWAALVDHVHADRDGKWHGGMLTRDETEDWLADEAGRPWCREVTIERFEEEA